MKNRYSYEEDQAILERVKAMPTNLSQAFELAAKATGRSEASIGLHWYRTLRGSAAIFSLAGKNNTKNVVRINPEEALKRYTKRFIEAKQRGNISDAAAIKKAMRALITKL